MTYPQQELKPLLRQLPNILTMARIVSIPIFLIFYPLFSNSDNFRIFMGFLYGAASLTDVLDGYLARHFKAESSFGAILDPIADKLLSATGLLLLASHSKIPVLIAGLLLLRDIAINGLRMIAIKENRDIEVNLFGKTKTSLQMLAISLLLGDYPLFGLPIHAMGVILIWLALLLSYYSAYTYVKTYLQLARK